MDFHCDKFTPQPVYWTLPATCNLQTLRYRPLIRVGIATQGDPQLTPAGEDAPEGAAWHLGNMLIGRGFHWQRTLEGWLPGEVECFPVGDDGIGLVVNRLPVESYLECVVGSEMNPAAPTEFLKAHAVISRSWALRMLRRSGTVGRQSQSRPFASLLARPEVAEQHLAAEEIYLAFEDVGDHAADGYDLCNDDHCQRYQGLTVASPEALNAIRSTAGMVLADASGEPMDARFSKCCGGMTELFSTCWQEYDLPYLKGKGDPWCDLSGMAPQARRALLASVLKPYDMTSREETALWNRWHSELPLTELRSRLTSLCGRDIGKVMAVKPLHRGVSGRIDLLLIEGELGRMAVGKELVIRRLLSPDCLMSSAFEVTIADDQLMIDGRGWGHGVGLCQIGAARMAAVGRSFREILAFYFGIDG